MVRLRAARAGGWLSAEGRVVRLRAARAGGWGGEAQGRRVGW